MLIGTKYKKGKVYVEFTSLNKKRQLKSKITRHRLYAHIINDTENQNTNNKNNYIHIHDAITFHKRRLLWNAKTKAKEANRKFV